MPELVLKAVGADEKVINACKSSALNQVTGELEEYNLAGLTYANGETGKFETAPEDSGEKLSDVLRFIKEKFNPASDNTVFV